MDNTIFVSSSGTCGEFGQQLTNVRPPKNSVAISRTTANNSAAETLALKLYLQHNACGAGSPSAKVLNFAYGRSKATLIPPLYQCREVQPINMSIE